MGTQVIKIKKGKDGSLVLSDRGITKAEQGDTIIWQIENHSGVHSIIRIEKKPRSDNVFSREPHQQGNHWRAIINPSAPCGDVYHYSIFWKESENGPELEHDPIISIRPSRFVDTIEILAIAVATFILGIFTINFWQQKRL